MVSVLLWKSVDIRDVERLLYPVKPTVITAEAEKRVGGMLAAWWTQVSFNPMLVAVAVAPERFTYRLLKNSKVFGLNFLDFKFVDKMPFLGDVSERFMRGKLERGGFRIVRGEKTGAPLIAEASAALELEKVNVLNVGDHDLFLGRVEAAYAIGDFEGGMWKLKDYSPIFYLGRTRRPARVRRFYIAAKEFLVRDLDLAGGELRSYFEDRIALRNEIAESLKSRSNPEDIARRLAEIARRKNLDDEDLMLLLDDAMREGIINEEELRRIEGELRKLL